MIESALRKELLRSGATVVGFALVRQVLTKEIAHLDRAVSIGVDKKLSRNSVTLLSSLEKKASAMLKGAGYRYLIIPPDSDRAERKFVSTLYPAVTHKMAATSAGLGWIGKNGLLISRLYGPRLSLATVLTDAALEVEAPTEFSACGDCTLCADFCPSQAITGREWSRYEPHVELIMADRCRTHKNRARTHDGKPNCGLCINICPYGRRTGRVDPEERGGDLCKWKAEKRVAVGPPSR